MVERVENARVEVVDLRENTTTGEETDRGTLHWPVSRSFRYVEILDNGWVKCVDGEHVDGMPDDEQTVDYYPPERINEVGTIEDRSRDLSDAGGGQP